MKASLPSCINNRRLGALIETPEIGRKSSLRRGSVVINDVLAAVVPDFAVSIAIVDTNLKATATDNRL